MIPERMDPVEPQVASPEVAKKLLEGFLKAIRDEQALADADAEAV